MARWLYRMAVGLAAGIAALAALPGHQSLGVAMGAILSLTGAAGGVVVAEFTLPYELRRAGGFFLAALGALAMLLLYTLFSPG